MNMSFDTEILKIILKLQFCKNSSGLIFPITKKLENFKVDSSNQSISFNINREDFYSLNSLNENPYQNYYLDFNFPFSVKEKSKLNNIKELFTN